MYTFEINSLAKRTPDGVAVVRTLYSVISAFSSMFINSFIIIAFYSISIIIRLPQRHKKIKKLKKAKHIQSIDEIRKFILLYLHAEKKVIILLHLIKLKSSLYVRLLCNYSYDHQCCVMFISYSSSPLSLSLSLSLLQQHYCSCCCCFVVVIIIINAYYFFGRDPATRAYVPRRSTLACAVLHFLSGLRFAICAVDPLYTSFLAVARLGQGMSSPADGAALDFDTNDNLLSLREAKRRAKYLNSKALLEEKVEKAREEFENVVQKFQDKVGVEVCESTPGP